MKVLNIQEVYKHKNPLLFTDSYEVKFWLQNDQGYWAVTFAYYYSTSKAAHRKVELRWKKDYCMFATNLISITYE